MIVLSSVLVEYTLISLLKMEKRAIARLHRIPLANEFSSQIEPCNVPVVFDGCVCDWPAVNKWNPNNGGLDHLEVRVGSSMVEAMVSRSGSVFYGDIRSHDRIRVSFSSFIHLCKKSRQIHNDAFVDKCSEDACHTLKIDSIEDPLSNLEDGSQIYLAQVPLINKDEKGESPLGALLEDIIMPRFLETNVISICNLWMNITQSRSSTHYDPHHNLLCVVAGCKQVALWPPSATEFLYPMSVCGEASNHSAVDLVQPNFKVHPRAKHAWDHCQKVLLHAGDALFIPEGWFHQVDSNALTVAVNFWWPSKIMLAMESHMDAYYLRRITSRLVDYEKEKMLKAVSVDNCEEEGSKKTEKTEKENFMNSMNVRESIRLINLDKYNCKGDASSLLEEDKGKSSYDRMVSSEDNCTRCVSSMNQNQSPKKCECSLQTAERQHSAMAVSFVDYRDIDSSLPQEIGSIVEKEQNSSVMACRSGDLNSCSSDPTSSRWNIYGADFRKIFVLQKLDVYESDALNALISSVHEKMGDAVQSQTSQSVKVGNQSRDRRYRDRSDLVTFPFSECLKSYSKEDDIVAKILGHLQPLTLQKLLLVMVNQFPRTLEALIIHGLSPIGAEIMTRKFDEMDKEVAKEEQEEFYRLFYSVFDDQHAAMETILKGKECFSFLALKNVMELYLGLTCESLKSYDVEKLSELE